MSLRRLTLVALASLCAIGLVVDAAAACERVDVTGTSRQLLGAYVNPDETWNGLADDERKVSTFESEIGRALDIDMHYYRWDDAFPTALEEWDAAGCRVPMISWAGTDLDSILSGRYDSLIRARARAVQRFNHKIFLRWGYEMNGDWWDWTATRSPDAATKFVSAWRRINRIFRSARASNTIWVWAPNETGGDPLKDPRPYYPGDDVVDWIGIDGYNWGSSMSASSWRSFGTIFGPLYGVFAGRKPLMISETASSEHGGDKAAWIDDLAQALPHQFPAVRAVVWFHANKETDWRVNSTPAALAAFRRFASTTKQP
ncbi:MAG: GH26 [uncultured Solirubrobacteraceae bacterium]|uniref:GH26 n=1 Tax=uncultured Solirubrobacteraceae bacterium TaxID=1162706 RepID=A0A6J4SBB3_9ACTN|nr:MAG: GH26 [uncultured Solirubrobacteraceae bacterium]